LVGILPHAALQVVRLVLHRSGIAQEATPRR
jgi:hypothetical protein